MRFFFCFVVFFDTMKFCTNNINHKLEWKILTELYCCWFVCFFISYRYMYIRIVKLNTLDVWKCTMISVSSSNSDEKYNLDLNFLIFNHSLTTMRSSCNIYNNNFELFIEYWIIVEFSITFFCFYRFIMFTYTYLHKTRREIYLFVREGKIWFNLDKLYKNKGIVFTVFGNLNRKEVKLLTIKHDNVIFYVEKQQLICVILIYLFVFFFLNHLMIINYHKFFTRLIRAFVFFSSSTASSYGNLSFWKILNAQRKPRLINQSNFHTLAEKLNLLSCPWYLPFDYVWYAESKNATTTNFIHP